MRNFLFPLLLFLTAMAPASELQAAKAITTVDGLHAFFSGFDHIEHNFTITGLVTFAHTSRIAPTQNSLVLKGATNSVYFFNIRPKIPFVGSIVAIKGTASLSKKNEPWMICSSIETIGRGHPPEIQTATLTALRADQPDLQPVRTEGTIVDVIPDEIDPSNAYVLLKDNGTMLSAACPISSQLKNMIDARVTVQGLFFKHIYTQRKHLGPCLSLSGIDAFTVLTPPPTDPFDFPPLPRQLYLSPLEVARLGKRSITGHVIARWQNYRLYVATDDSKIIGVELSEGEQLPDYGTFVKVVGNPETDLYRIILTGARVRPEDGPALTEDEANPLTIKTLFTKRGEAIAFNDDVRGNLATVSGVVRLLPAAGGEERRLTIDCGQYKIPVDYSANPTAADRLTIGCTVEVTGRCLLEADKWQPSRIFPRISGLVIVIRRPDDIRVLSRPSWWTPRRLMMIIGVLLLTLVGVYVRNRILKRMGELKVGERTRLAVELHDSLSQTLAGVACQIAASDNAIDAENAVAKDRIKTAERMLKSCRTELRHCLFDLRSDTLEEKDFSAALRKTLDQLEGDADIAVRFNVPRTLLNDAVAHAIIAIVRELTSNALRHGGATKVRIAGSVEDGFVRFSVADNGCGFDPARCVGSLEGHFGLEGIRDRMKKLRGTFEINSAPDKGTKAVLSLPLKA